MTRAGYTIISLLVVINVLLLVQVLRRPGEASRISADPSEYMTRTSLPDVYLLDSVGQNVRLLTLLEEKAPSLLIVFSPSDCPACMEERRLWSQVYRSGRMPVIGIAASASADEFWTWAAQLKFDIPLYLDTCFAVPDSMGLRVMPLKMVVDQTGRIRWADPPRLSNGEWKEFLHDLDREIEKMH